MAFEDSEVVVTGDEPADTAAPEIAASKSKAALLTVPRSRPESIPGETWTALGLGRRVTLSR